MLCNAVGARSRIFLACVEMAEVTAVVTFLTLSEALPPRLLELDCPTGGSCGSGGSWRWAVVSVCGVGADFGVSANTYVLFPVVTLRGASAECGDVVTWSN